EHLHRAGGNVGVGRLLRIERVAGIPRAGREHDDEAPRPADDRRRRTRARQRGRGGCGTTELENIATVQHQEYTARRSESMAVSVMIHARFAPPPPANTPRNTASSASIGSS